MRKLIILAAAAIMASPAMAKAKKETPNKDSLIFTTVIANPVTSIKNQNSSGTCWAYSSSGQDPQPEEPGHVLRHHLP